MNDKPQKPRKPSPGPPPEPEYQCSNCGAINTSHGTCWRCGEPI